MLQLRWLCVLLSLMFFIPPFLPSFFSHFPLRVGFVEPFCFDFLLFCVVLARRLSAAEFNTSHLWFRAFEQWPRPIAGLGCPYPSSICSTYHLPSIVGLLGFRPRDLLLSFHESFLCSFRRCVVMSDFGT